MSFQARLHHWTASDNTPACYGDSCKTAARLSYITFAIEICM